MIEGYVSERSCFVSERVFGDRACHHAAFEPGGAAQSSPAVAGRRELGGNRFILVRDVAVDFPEPRGSVLRSRRAHRLVRRVRAIRAVRAVGRR